MQTNFETAVAVRDFSDTSDKSRKRKIGVVVVGLVLLVAAGVAIGVYFGLKSSSSSSSSSAPGAYTKGLVVNQTLRASLDISTPMVRNAGALPSAVDWRSKPNMVGPIKNQQQCGSCWAFSTSDAVEAAYGAATNTPIQPVSVQQIISCDSGNGDQGCNGGDPAQALSGYLSSNALTSAKNYPYSSNTAAGNADSCDASKAGTADSAQNWFPVQVDASKPVVYAVSPCSGSSCPFTQAAENSLMQALTKGLVSICIDASGWNNYQGGIVDGSGSDAGGTQCTGANGADASRSAVDHAVSVVGYNTDSTGSYWIVRNQWGTSWGINGYIYLKRGQNTCCILCEAVQTNVKPTIAAATTRPPTAAATTKAPVTKSPTTSGSNTGSVATTDVAVATTAQPTTAAVATTQAGTCSLSACTNPVSLTDVHCACSIKSAVTYLTNTYYNQNYLCSADKKGLLWCCWAPASQDGYSDPSLSIIVASTGATRSVQCSYSENSGGVAPTLA